MTGNEKDFGGYVDEHHLTEIRRPPDSLIELRNLLQLPQYNSIKEKAAAASTFEEALGIIALQLDILLDGTYDVGPLCAMLVKALENKDLHKNSPHLRAPGLVNAELVEREDSVELLEKKDTGNE